VLTRAAMPRWPTGTTAECGGTGTCFGKLNLYARGGHLQSRVESPSPSPLARAATDERLVGASQGCRFQQPGCRRCDSAGRRRSGCKGLIEPAIAHLHVTGRCAVDRSALPVVRGSQTSAASPIWTLWDGVGGNDRFYQSHIVRIWRINRGSLDVFPCHNMHAVIVPKKRRSYLTAAHRRSQTNPDSNRLPA